MKTLFLLRHAKSSWEERLGDHERPLSGRGRRAAKAMGEFMAERGLLPDRVICSTAARTVETWSLISPLLGEPRVDESRVLYLASTEELLEVVRGGGATAERLLLVGHNTGIENLASWLIGGGDHALIASLRRKYPTGALTTLLFPITAWSDLDPGAGELEIFVRPKDLPGAKHLNL